MKNWRDDNQNSFLVQRTEDNSLKPLCVAFYDDTILFEGEIDICVQ